MTKTKIALIAALVMGTASAAMAEDGFDPNLANRYPGYAGPAATAPQAAFRSTPVRLYQGRNVARGGRFCDQRDFNMPFLHEFKLAGNYTLPLGVDIGAVVQSFGGLERVIQWAPAANLFPNGQRTQAQTLLLTAPGTLYGERWDQLDVNFKKNFRYANRVHTFQLDVFNVFNNNSIRTMNDTVGNSLGQVTAIMPGRFPRIAYQFKW